MDTDAEIYYVSQIYIHSSQTRSRSYSKVRPLGWRGYMDKESLVKKIVIFRGVIEDTKACHPINA